MSESQEAPVVFSNKARRGNIRKKKRGEGDDEEDETGDVRALLEETKREQKYRARGGGVDTGTLLTGGAKRKSEVVLDDVAEQSLFESQFSAENEGGAGNLSVMEQVSGPQDSPAHHTHGVLLAIIHADVLHNCTYAPSCPPRTSFHMGSMPYSRQSQTGVCVAIYIHGVQ